MTTWPAKTGWHKVKHADGYSATWYIFFVSPEFFSWGWDEEDDSEAIGTEEATNEGMTFEECERPADR